MRTEEEEPEDEVNDCGCEKPSDWPVAVTVIGVAWAIAFCFHSCFGMAH